MKLNDKDECGELTDMECLIFKQKMYYGEPINK